MNAPCPLPPRAGGALIDDEAWPTGVQVASRLSPRTGFRRQLSSKKISALLGGAMGFNGGLMMTERSPHKVSLVREFSLIPPDNW